MEFERCSVMVDCGLNLKGLILSVFGCEGDFDHKRVLINGGGVLFDDQLMVMIKDSVRWLMNYWGYQLKLMEMILGLCIFWICCRVLHGVIHWVGLIL